MRLTGLHAARKCGKIKGMISPERTKTPHPEYPFLRDKIPVANGVEGFASFVENYPNFSFCPYIADKDTEGWEVSTSRVYMNQVLPNFLYVPVNITKNDLTELSDFFEFVQNRSDIPAVNITQPHKSSPVLRELYLGDSHSTANVDTLIRNYNNQLEPYDLNSAAFIEWYKQDVGSFEAKAVILVGVGGVGEPIAKKIAAEKPARLTLIDITDKSSFASDLSKATDTPTGFASSLKETSAAVLPEDTIIINAAGKEGASDESELWALLQQHVHGGIFVDIRPHLDIAIVEEAKRHGWDAYTGHGMNAHNDYVLLQGIVRQIPGAVPPSFEEFQQLVAQAS